MAIFIATMSYELKATTEPDARKLLRAELVGRRWQDRVDGAALPSNTVWMKRAAPVGHTVSVIREECGRELEDAVAAVAKTGRSIALIRAWTHVSGAGTCGLIDLRAT